MLRVRLLVCVLVAVLVASLISSPPSAVADVDVYVTPGLHHVNGREWRTSCEKYSSTVDRCRTEIKATQVAEVDGRFVQATDWVFNNLTYKASPRSQWKGNPLAANGVVGGKVAWTAADGRQWRTECDSAVTGQGGCRSWAQARIIESYVDAGGNRAYRWVTREVFNNMVRFLPPAPTVKPTPSVKPSPSARPTTPSPSPTTPPAPGAHLLGSAATQITVPGLPSGAESVLVRVIAHPTGGGVTVRHAGSEVVTAGAGAAVSGTFLARVTNGQVALSASSAVRVDVEPVAWFSSDPALPGSVVALASPERRADTREGEAGSALSGTPVTVGLVGKGGVPSTDVRQVFVTMTVMLDRAGTVRLGSQVLALPQGVSTVSTVITPSATGDVEVSATGASGSLVLDVRGYVVEALDTGGRVNAVGSVLPAVGAASQSVTATASSPAGVAAAGFNDAATQLVLVSAPSTGTDARVSGNAEPGTGAVIDKAAGAVPQLVLTSASAGRVSVTQGSRALNVQPVAVVLGEAGGTTGAQPQLQITSPGAGASVDLAEELVELTGTITSATAIDRIEVRAGGVLVGHATLTPGPSGQSWSFRTAAPQSGTVTFQVSAITRADRTASASRAVNVTVPGPDAVVLNDEAAILNTTDLTGLESSTDEVLVFTTRPDVGPGQPMVGAPSDGAPDGFLRTVVAIDQIDGQWQVATEPAALTDIILQSSETDEVDLFALTGATVDDDPAQSPNSTTGVTVIDEGVSPITVLSGDDVEVGPFDDDASSQGEGTGHQAGAWAEPLGAPALPPGAAARSGAPAVLGSGSGGGFGIEESITGSIGAEFSWSTRLGEDQKDTSKASASTRAAERAAVEQSGGISVEASAQLSAKLDVVLRISVDFDFGKPSPKVDEFSVVLHTSARARAVLAAYYEARTTDTYKRTLGIIELPSLTFYINAPTPVPIVIDNTITLSLIGELDAKFQASVEYAVQRTESYGFTYSTDGGIQQVHDGPTVTQRTPVFGENPNGRAEGTLDVWIALEAELSMLIYGYAGPVFTASIGPGVEAAFVADAATGVLAASVEVYLQAGVSGRLVFTVPIIDHQLLNQQLFERRWRLDIISFTWNGDDIFGQSPGGIRPVPPTKDLGWVRAARFGGGWTAGMTSVVDRARDRVVVVPVGHTQEAPDETYPFDARHAWVLESGVVTGLIRMPDAVRSAAMVPGSGRVLVLDQGTASHGDSVELRVLNPATRTVGDSVTVATSATCERIWAESVWVGPTGSGVVLGDSVTYPRDDDGDCMWGWQPEKQEHLAWIIDADSLTPQDQVTFDRGFHRSGVDLQFAPDGSQAYLFGNVDGGLQAAYVTIPLNGSLLEGPTAIGDLSWIDSASVDPRDGTVVLAGVPLEDVANDLGDRAFASNLWRFDPTWGDLLERPAVIDLSGQVQPGGVMLDYRGVTFDDGGRLFGVALDRTVIGSYDNGGANLRVAATGELGDLAAVPSNVQRLGLWHYAGQQLMQGPGDSLLLSDWSSPTYLLTLPADTEASVLALPESTTLAGTEIVPATAHTTSSNCSHVGAGRNDLCGLGPEGPVSVEGSSSQPLTLRGLGDPIPLGPPGSPRWLTVLSSGHVVVNAVAADSQEQMLYRVDPSTRQVELLDAPDLTDLFSTVAPVEASDGSLYFIGSGWTHTPEILIRLEPDGVVTTTPLRFQDTGVALARSWNSASNTSLWGSTVGPISLAPDGVHGFIVNDQGLVAKLDLAMARVSWVSGVSPSERSPTFMEAAVTAAPDGGAYVVLDDSLMRLNASGRTLWTRILLPEGAEVPTGPWGIDDAPILGQAVAHSDGVTVISRPTEPGWASTSWGRLGLAWTVSPDGDLIQTAQLPIPNHGGYTFGFQVESDGRIGWWSQTQHGVVGLPAVE